MPEQTSNLPIQASLIDDTKSLAKELNISWSQLIAIALRDFIHRYQGRKQLVEEINAAYSDTNDYHELQQQRRVSHRKIVEGEW